LIHFFKSQIFIYYILRFIEILKQLVFFLCRLSEIKYTLGVFKKTFVASKLMEKQFKHGGKMIGAQINRAAALIISH